MAVSIGSTTTCSGKRSHRLVPGRAVLGDRARERDGLGEDEVSTHDGIAEVRYQQHLDMLGERPWNIFRIASVPALTCINLHAQKVLSWPRRRRPAARPVPT